ncbi:MAG: DMT family transporter, partial [Elusimicrobia bacterium]|nr:DMT family transporter [Elusimicrobiota bacterium]
MSPLTALWTNWVTAGVWPIASGHTAQKISPILSAGLAAFLALVYFSPRLTREKMWGKFFDRKLILPLAVMGGLGSGLAIIMFVTGLKYTTPSNAAIIAQVEIIYSLLLARIFLGEKISRSKMLGAGLVIFGTGLVLFKERFSPRWTGDLIIAVTPWMFQVAHIFAKKLPADLPDYFVAAARSFFALIFLSFVSAGVLISGKFYFTPDYSTWLALAFWGFISCGWVMVLWYRAIRNMDLGKASII